MRLNWFKLLKIIIYCIGHSWHNNQSIHVHFGFELYNYIKLLLMQSIQVICSFRIDLLFDRAKSLNRIKQIKGSNRLRSNNILNCIYAEMENKQLANIKEIPLIRYNMSNWNLSMIHFRISHFHWMSPKWQYIIHISSNRIRNVPKYL